MQKGERKTGKESLQRKRRQQQRTENALQETLSMSLRIHDRSVISFITVETALVSHTRNLSNENVKWTSITIPVWFGVLTNEYGTPREGITICPCLREYLQQNEYGFGI